MGMITPPSDYDSSSASKPKERQFQVVPVPGTFTRGRWKCFDYRESAAAPDGMLELPKPGSSDTTTDEKGGNAENVDPSEVESVVESVGVLPQPEKTPPPLSKTESESTIVVTSVASAEATPTPTRRVVSGANVAEPETPTQTPARPSFSQPPATINTLEQLKNPRFVISEADLLRNASSATVNWPVIGFDKEATHTIDIKIEQAMDLVKSHLTFAVREEVEEMRATIAQQKARIAQVESENDLLRQFAPPEIVDNITNLVQVRLSPAPTSLETSPEQTVSEPAPTNTPDPTASASAPALPTADAAVAAAPVVIRNEPPTAPELPETTQESPTTSASATSSSS